MAAPFQNYGGGTFLPDLVTRPEFLSYISEEIFERCPFIQSGVMVRNSALDCRAGGVRVRVPFFQPINPTEETIESNNTWGTSGAGYLTPQKITADEQIMTIMHPWLLLRSGRSVSTGLQTLTRWLPSAAT